MRSFALILAASPVLAEDGFDPSIAQACLVSDDPHACIGAAAAACLETDQGTSTLGVAYCYGDELAIWDNELNRAYRALREYTHELDTDLDAIDSPATRSTMALRDAQRAWIAWRDAQCGYVQSTFQGGTGGGPAFGACALRLTAEQALRLDSYLAEQGG